ncbi:transport system permease protein [Bibersteinia trehalosi USDA-ARS-USMARC-188]|uniref:Transport system permease protein n=3 Tax=Bibersteinia trehalosi TaxID=47735 RepID=A0A4V7IC73_BIBTR|nr:MFS transporter [Bibersteinia trehalosi]AGH37585.1 transport system permease protein [Bibersteinia trehalosi USDA-ARS-USMARC-192]AHG82606.1 transport system permease protein [Bibersteinia trehalosi USDA-ARS-USMARC-188]AHG84940.1 transport system permease protein [Bibersteinia trehalosi USDA-ARS-USMARC-189]
MQMNMQNMILWRRFFSGLAYTAMQSVFFVYLQHYKGFESAQIAAAFSLLVFTSQAMALPAGYLGDRFGRTLIMTLGCLLDALGYVFLVGSEQYASMMLATFCFGFGSTLFSTNARAYMISHAEGDNYSSKTMAQGKFLKISSLASMAAPLLALPFIHFNHADWLIWTSCGIELAMLLFMLRTVPKSDLRYANSTLKWQDIKAVLGKRFIFAHFLLFIPLGLGSSFYIIFPYVFTNMLDHSELIPIAFFINNLIGVLLQARFSRKINFGVGKLLFLAPALTILLIVPWFLTLSTISILTAFSYLILFALISLFTSTALANLLVRVDHGQHQGVLFGMSKLILSLTTALVMNIVPYIFLV